MASNSNEHEKRFTLLENGVRTILEHIKSQQQIMRTQQERSDRKFVAMLERIDRQQDQLDKHQQQLDKHQQQFDRHQQQFDKQQGQLDFVIRWMKKKMEGQP